MVFRRNHMLFAAAIVSGAAMALLVPAGALPADQSLARLVLFVAAIQFAACLTVMAAALWRLRDPGPAAAYAFGLGIMAIGPGLVAGGHARGGALCFWGGVALWLIVAAIDHAGWRRTVAGYRASRRIVRGRE